MDYAGHPHFLGQGCERLQRRRESRDVKKWPITRGCSPEDGREEFRAKAKLLISYESLKQSTKASELLKYELKTRNEGGYAAY